MSSLHSIGCDLTSGQAKTEKEYRIFVLHYDMDESIYDKMLKYLRNKINKANVNGLDSLLK